MERTPEEKLLDAIMQSPSQSEVEPELDAAASRIDIKVQGGTPIHGGSLCNTCRHAQRIQGFSTSQEVVLCTATGYGPRKVPFPVSSCSVYDDQRLPSLYEMKEIAWQVVTKPNRQIGFVSAKEFKQMRGREME